jgi:hypothetical protein
MRQCRSIAYLISLVLPMAIMAPSRAANWSDFQLADSQTTESLPTVGNPKGKSCSIKAKHSCQKSKPAQHLDKILSIPSQSGPSLPQLTCQNNSPNCQQRDRQSQKS